MSVLREGPLSPLHSVMEAQRRSPQWLRAGAEWRLLLS